MLSCPNCGFWIVDFLIKIIYMTLKEVIQFPEDIEDRSSYGNERLEKEIKEVLLKIESLQKL